MAEIGVSFKESSTSKIGADSISESRDPTEPVTNQQRHADKLKTIEVLMGWPIFSLSVRKTQQFYEMLRSSSRIINWSCQVSGKVASTLVEHSPPVKAILCPAVRIVDLATSDVAETVQKKLPVVRQSPSKVYQAVKSGVHHRIASVVDYFDFMVYSGERRLRRFARITAWTCRELADTLDKWMEEVEGHLEKPYPKAPQVPGEEPPKARMWALAKTAFNLLTNIAMFYIGATVWVTSRLPLVGQFVSPSPYSSKPTSPTHMGQKSSSSSYESIPECTAAEAPVKMCRSDLNLENQPSTEVSCGP